MDREQAKNYLRNSGYSEEQIKTIETAFEDKAREYEEGIKYTLEQIDYNVSIIEQDFEENQDNVRNCSGGVYLRGQLKIYKELRGCLEQILEGAEG